MAHISNARVVRASKYVKGIDIGLLKEYNPIEMFIDSENVGNFENKSQIALILDTYSTQKFRADIINDNNTLDKLCILCVGSKLTQVIRRNKNMIPTINKLEKVHVDL